MKKAKVTKFEILLLIALGIAVFIILGDSHSCDCPETRIEYVYRYIKSSPIPPGKYWYLDSIDDKGSVLPPPPAVRFEDDTTVQINDTVW